MEEHASNSIGEDDDEASWGRMNNQPCRLGLKVAKPVVNKWLGLKKTGSIGYPKVRGSF